MVWCLQFQTFLLRCRGHLDTLRIVTGRKPWYCRSYGFITLFEVIILDWGKSIYTKMIPLDSISEPILKIYTENGAPGVVQWIYVPVLVICLHQLRRWNPIWTCSTELQYTGYPFMFLHYQSIHFIQKFRRGKDKIDM